MLASYGHVRDLPARAGAVDPDDGFAMQWALVDRAAPHVAAIAAAARGAGRVVLATDPDREGEAISWHLLHELQVRLGASAGRQRSVRGLQRLPEVAQTFSI